MNLLPWDTKFFGFRIGRAGLVDLDGTVLRAREDGVECVYLVDAASRLEEAEEAIRRGARLVDLRCELELEGPVAAEDRLATRLAGPDEQLGHLAEALSAHSRFRADARFPPVRVAEMYRLWLDQCLTGGAVALPADRDAGMVAGRVVDTVARIELVYVDPAHSGRGVARALVAAVIEALGAQRATVVTQAANVPALRAYQSLGFRTRSVDTVLHLWLDELR